MNIEPIPIGFEDILTRPQPSVIGFEEFEHQTSPFATSTYPTGSYANATIPHQPPSSSSTTTRRRVSFQQLFATYNEIQTVWFQEEWLSFTNQDTRTYLTLNCRDYDSLTLQTAIDQRLFTVGNQSLLYQPECLILRTTSKTTATVLPNVAVSVDALCHRHAPRTFSSYRLMAMICHSNETGSQVMFYKHFPTNLWYVFYDQSIHCPAYSNILSDHEQTQLEAFLVSPQSTRTRRMAQFTSLPLSLLHNHPTIFVYLGERKRKTSVEQWFFKRSIVSVNVFFIQRSAIWVFDG